MDENGWVKKGKNYYDIYFVGLGNKKIIWPLHPALKQPRTGHFNFVNILSTKPAQTSEINILKKENRRCQKELGTIRCRL